MVSLHQASILFKPETYYRHELKSTESSHSKTPCQEKAGNFLFGRDAYQYYLRHRGELDYIDRQVILPHVAELRQRLVNKKKHVSEVLERARGWFTRTISTIVADISQRCTNKLL